MPRDGCKQCSKRRIKCDKTEPTCQKCATKGLQCSGIGLQYRFVADQNYVRYAKRRAERRGVSQPSGTRAVTDAGDLIRPQAESLESPEPSQVVFVGSSSRRGSTASRASEESQMQDVVEIPRYDLSSSLLLEPLRPGISMLFDHFSSSIAPAMVAFDNPANGYRHLILPFAMQDDLVQRAVCVVSAFHLSAMSGQSSEIAEIGRSAIIARLRANLEGGDALVFNHSTLITLLVLLVGETVTGSTEFGYLYKMLTATLQDGRAIAGAPNDARGFLLQQSRMFQLFTPAFIESQAGTNLLNGNLEIYLDWLLSHQSSQPGLSDLVVTYKSAIELARDIYLLERTQGSERESVQSKISCLRELTTSIGAQTPGMHCLVWPYFIAGASSILPEDRQYFEAKLDQVHQQTRMRNIVVAMESLTDIWRQHPTGGWALHLDRLRPVLAM